MANEFRGLFEAIGIIFDRMEQRQIEMQNDLKRVVSFVDGQQADKNRNLSVKDVARLTGFEEQTIYNKVQRKTLPFAFFKAGRKLCFPYQAVIDWVENSKNGSAPTIQELTDNQLSKKRA